MVTLGTGTDGLFCPDLLTEKVYFKPTYTKTGPDYEGNIVQIFH